MRKEEFCCKAQINKADITGKFQQVIDIVMIVKVKYELLIFKKFSETFNDIIFQRRFLEYIFCDALVIAFSFG